MRRKIPIFGVAKPGSPREKSPIFLVGYNSGSPGERIFGWGITRGPPPKEFSVGHNSGSPREKSPIFLVG